MMRSSRVFALSAFAIVFAATASRAQETDPFSALAPVAGDSHQHGGELYTFMRSQLDPAGLKAEGAYCYGPNGGNCSFPHELGYAASSYALMRNEGYDWGSVSHHDTNHPTSRGVIAMLETSVKWAWWRDHVDANGFWAGGNPFAGYVTPKWSEARALSMVGAQQSSATFVGLPGREFTTYDLPTSVFAKGVPGRTVGHKIVIMPGTNNGMCAERASGSFFDNLNGDELCSSEYELYRWLQTQVVNGANPADLSEPRGVVIMAHPSYGAFSIARLNPVISPGGISDAFVQGIEMGTGFTAPLWEPQFQQAMRAGLRFFPAYGSDHHDINDPLPSSSIPLMVNRYGATVCWVDALTPRSLLAAMQARRCYYSTAGKPALKYYMRDDASKPWALMGSTIALPDHRADIRVVATNVPVNNNASPTKGYRFDLVELVDANNQVVASGPCTRSSTLGGSDTCNLQLDNFLLADGGVYPRIRMTNPAPEAGPGACRTDPAAVAGNPGLQTSCTYMVIGAGIYVNWAQYQQAIGYANCSFGYGSLPCASGECTLPASVDADGDGLPGSCDNCPAIANGFAQANVAGVGNQPDFDFDGIGDVCDPDDDGDTVPDPQDNCPTVASANTADEDLDGLGDVCDNCPDISNPGQEDLLDVEFAGIFGQTQPHPDGVGDACDNCVHYYNPRVTAALGADRSTTGGQMDDDADGFGNACDLDFDNDGVVRDLVTPMDEETGYEACGESMDFALFGAEMGHATNASDCGESSSLPCKLLDLNGDQGASIDGNDTVIYYAMVGGVDHFAEVKPIPLGPKCPACPLDCEGPACDAHSDADAVRDGRDNCPSVANADQLDGDGDGVGQACDSCSSVANPRLPLGCQATLSWVTTSGAFLPPATQLGNDAPRAGQRDDDADGFGNVCDGKFPGTAGLLVGGLDLGQFNASQGKGVELDTCGTALDRACAYFDLTESGFTVDQADRTVFQSLNGQVPGPRCSSCGNFTALPCLGDNCP